jgi:hypothetical protein
MNTESTLSKNTSNEAFLILSIDIICLILSPFILNYFIAAFSDEKLSHLFWIFPFWILLIFVTDLDNKIKGVKKLSFAKFSKLYSGFIAFAAITYGFLLVGITCGLSGVFSNFDDGDKAVQGEKSIGPFLLIFFSLITLAFTYIYILLSPFLRDLNQTIEAPQKKYYLTLALVPIATNFSSLLFAAFWVAKFPNNNSSEIIPFSEHIIQALIMTVVMIYFCGSARLILLHKRFSLISLISFISYFYYLAWMFTSK